MLGQPYKDKVLVNLGRSKMAEILGVLRQCKHGKGKVEDGKEVAMRGQRNGTDIAWCLEKR